MSPAKDWTSLVISTYDLVVYLPLPKQVRTFLNLLPSSEADGEKFAANQPLEVLQSSTIASYYT